jgi:CNT family concentrative nucleoside transporter
MTGGFATVAGGVLAAYVGFLRDVFPDIAGHLMAASVLSAPAALVVAKVMYPETEESPTRGDVKLEVESDDANVIDAAARGAGEGLTLALNVGAMLLAFVALVAMMNYLFALPSYIQHGSALNTVIEQVADAGLEIPAEVAAACDPTTVSEATGGSVSLEARAGCVAQIQSAVWTESEPPAVTVWPTITLEKIFGVLFFPIALLMGVPLADCFLVGQLLGTKMVINEFVAYDNLSRILRDPAIDLHPRSMVIATYALCGFANFGSIAIQIGGIGGIAPERRRDLATLGLRAMIGGSLAAFMTATVAGILI